MYLSFDPSSVMICLFFNQNSMWDVCRVKVNAGALTNFEVVDLLNSRGTSNDTTRVIAPIARSEYKVYFDFSLKRDLAKELLFVL